MSSFIPTPDDHQLLRIYLRDHDGASAGGVRLVQRSLRSNRGTPFEAGLVALDSGIRADQAELGEMMASLRVTPSRLKRAATWLAASAGALKTNGHLLTYSPLSRVVELEALSAAVMAKLRLWTTLADLSTTDKSIDGAAIERLHAHARSQLEALGLLHRRATAVAFALQLAPTR